MKLKDECGCIFNDRIDLEVSPSDLEDLISIYKKKSLCADNYSLQGIYREKKDYFQSRYDAWKEARENYHPKVFKEDK